MALKKSQPYSSLWQSKVIEVVSTAVVPNA